jgi:hypothetical protein
MASGARAGTNGVDDSLDCFCNGRLRRCAQHRRLNGKELVASASSEPGVNALSFARICLRDVNGTVVQSFSFSIPIPNPNRPLVFPVLLLARRAVEEAMEDARKFQNGEPTEDAVDAILWIEATTDWTRMKRADGHVPIPPRECQAEFPGTFDWCCRLLGLAPEVVRQVGLPTTSFTRSNGNPTAGGLAAIYECWAEQRSAWLAKQENRPALEVPLPSACCHCGNEVPEGRLRRGSCTCSKECHDAEAERAQRRRRAQEREPNLGLEPLPSTFAPEAVGASDFN